MSRKQNEIPPPGEDGEDLVKKRRLSFDLEPSIPSHQRAIEFFENLPHGYMKKFLIAVAMSFDHLHPRDLKKVLDRISDVSPLPLPASLTNIAENGVTARVGASLDASFAQEKTEEEQRSKHEDQQPVRKRSVSGSLFKDG